MGVLKDGYFTTLKPADIITAVGTITLAVISTWLNDELARVGWYLRNDKGEIYLNPTIAQLYKLSYAGIWVAYPEKGIISYANAPEVLTTTDDTVVTLSGSSISTSGGISVVGRRLLSAYQNSGGGLSLNVYQDAGKTKLLYTKAVNSATPTILDGVAPFLVGTVYIAWSAAAGASQYVVYQSDLAAPAVLK